MSFGLSGSDEHSVMVGGDVVVAWVDRNTGKGYAVDYELDDKSQCSGLRGSCPDERISKASLNANSLFSYLMLFNLILLLPHSKILLWLFTVEVFS